MGTGESGGAGGLSRKDSRAQHADHRCICRDAGSTRHGCDAAGPQHAHKPASGLLSRGSHRRADVSWHVCAGTWRMCPPSCRCWSGSTAALQSAWRIRKRSSTTSTRTSAALPATCLSLCIPEEANRLSWRVIEDSTCALHFPANSAGSVCGAVSLCGLHGSRCLTVTSLGFQKLRQLGSCCFLMTAAAFPGVACCRLADPASHLSLLLCQF